MELPQGHHAQAGQCELHEVLMFIVLSMLDNASSYGMTEMSVRTRIKALNAGVGNRWGHAPSHVQIRNILLGTPPDQRNVQVYRSEVEGQYVCTIHHDINNSPALRSLRETLSGRTL